VRAATTLIPALRARRTEVVVVSGYTLVAFCCLGLPAILQGGDRYVGFGYDPQIFIWSFDWWPRAISHGENPFISHAIWAPDGINLTWTTAVPGLALLFSPLTLLVGPVLSYDVAATLMPALSAWTAFRLCRYVTGSLWPAIVGGYLFGFSSYVIAQAGQGHLHLSAVFLLPVIAHLALRFFDGELTRRRFALRLGPVFALQVLLATEVALTVAIAMIVAIAIAVVAVPARRRKALAMLSPLVGASAMAALILVPFLYFLLTDFHRQEFNDPDRFVADLANVVVPTRVTLLGGHWASGISQHFPGNDSERNGYLGVPVLLTVLWFGRERFRSASGRFLLAAAFVGLVAALGARGTVVGRVFSDMPWTLLHDLPVFSNVLTARLMVFVALACAVMVAIWASVPRRPLVRYGVPLLCAISLLPDPVGGGFATRYAVPPFFTDAAYRTCLDRGENILPLPPTGGTSLLWQVASGFRFSMTGGDVGPAIPPSFFAPGPIADITNGQPVDAAGFQEYAATKLVTSVVIGEADAGKWSGALDTLAPPLRVGGVVVYHLRANSPSCIALR